MLLRFIAWRLAGLLAVLLAMTFIIFLLRQVVPADPARAAVAPSAPAAVVEAKRHQLGLDQPIVVQYGRYLDQLLHGDLGQSVTTNNAVTTDLARALPASVELMLYGILLAVTLAGAFSLLETLFPRSELFRQVLVSGASEPVFLTGLLLLDLLWFQAGVFPSGGRTGVTDPPTGPTGLLTVDGLLHGRPAVTVDAFWHLALPALTLALPMALAVGRTLRSSIIGVQRLDHVRTARSKGLTDFQVVRRHVLRNASTGAVSMAGLQIGFMFANLLIVERIFAWPGVGLYLTEVLSHDDLSAVLGVSLVFGIAYVVLNALVDVFQVLADPRIALD
jgi:ABC-type dipeptide/oligopeptide/nickel transport system permease component